MHPQSKYPTPSDIDNIICVRIPDLEVYLTLYNLVKAHMIHGQYGLSRLTSPCMKNKKCSKYFPKKFTDDTIVDADGFPLYQRRTNTHVIHKTDIALDNMHVVPYNTRLLLKYQAYINMEWCNQSTSIKYLFKYIHKGYDRITATIVPSISKTLQDQEPIDDIKGYLDCRMENILEKPSVTESMFSSCLVANAKYEEACSLTYDELMIMFVYERRKRLWKPRKIGFTICRLIQVPPTTDNFFYLRMMLIVVKEPTSYEEICKVDDNQYDSFRDACFIMGSLKMTDNTLEISKRLVNEVQVIFFESFS
ncbi:hypothetical protein KIW84_014045 [Lathyrus oleraceus]|uniref:Uncharacterized protein n=1 Tax=Pisum sativum TaxID=3888 RepID=A0A9D5BM41_PEA|nr:hypothetical protein KIW84_014045 [Pisum sativum]